MLYSDIDAMMTLRGKATTEKVIHDMKSTKLVRHTDGSVAVQYHETEVLVFHPNNLVTLRTGGWFTQTTMRRMEDFLNSAQQPVTVQVGGNPWTVTTRRKNPAHRGYSGDTEPYWLAIDKHPYTEGMRVDLVTGIILDTGHMVDFTAHNKAMSKAIIKFVKGITPDALQNAHKYLYGTLGEDVQAGRYSRELFELMAYSGRWNQDFVFGSYIRPVLDGRAYDAEYSCTWIRREIISWLRAELLIGPVPIRKNYGKPRQIA